MYELEQIIRAVQAGQKEQYARLVQAFQQRIYVYCYYMLGQAQEAEDATQEVFLKAYKNIHHYTASTNFSAWLYRIAHNHSINLLRRRKRIRFLPMNQQSVDLENYKDRDLEQVELRDTVQKALRQLSPEEQSLIILRVIEDKSYAEMEEMLQIKAATLRKRFERAKKKLERQLFQQEGVIDSECSYSRDEKTSC